MPNLNFITRPEDAVNEQIMADMLDITGPAEVEVKFDKQRMVLWININGICALRACRIGNVTFES